MSGPPPAPPDWQSQQDSEHLRLLGILHYVSAALSGLGLLFGLLYMVFGVLGMVFPFDGADRREMVILGGIFGGLGLFIVLVSGVWVVAEVLAGRCLMASRGRTFCMVVAAMNCLSFPLGTAIGVFTFIVLSRPSVEARFARVAAGGTVHGLANA